MSIIQMSRTQKKWFSLAIAVILVCLAAMLSGCGNKEAEQAAAQHKTTNDAAKVFMKQGDGKIRKWGERRASAAGKEVDDAQK